MKSGFNLSTILCTISRFWAVGCCISIIYFFMNLVFSNTNFKIEKPNEIWGSTNMFTNGYAIKVNMEVQLPADTIIKYTKNKETGSVNLNKNAFFRYNKIDTILKDTTYKKQYHLNTWITEDYNVTNITQIYYESQNEFERYAEEIKKLKENINITPSLNYNVDVEVQMKTNNIFKNGLLVFYNLMPLLTSLLMAIICMKIFKSLYEKINFKKIIGHGFFNIGLVLILQQIFNLILSFIISRWFSLIHLKELTVGFVQYNYNNAVVFTPTINFSFSMVFLGMCIMLVSYVFKYGNKIEQENALTV